MAGPMPQGQAQGAEPTAPGGASQLVADIHTKLLNLQELVDGKFPEDAQELAGITQAYQSFVEKLGQSPGQKAPEAAPGTTTPEAGAASVRPAM